MTERLDTREGITYRYIAGEDGATLTAVTPCAGELSLPATLGEEALPLVAIGRKCCLGAGRLTALRLPESVTLIDDWAFTGCGRLRRVTLPRVRLGQGVFWDCRALRALELTDENAAGAPFSQDTAALLAAAAQRRDAVYLCDLREAGSAEWYRRFDAWLEKLFEASDQEGYSGQVPCGEEDYGSSDVAAYESGRRREKCELTLLRLIHDERASEALRERLRAYAAAHTAGSPHGEECWQVVLQRHAQERDWYEVFTRIGCVSADNRDRILAEIPPECVELKAHLINAAGGEEDGGLLRSLAL